MNKSDCTSLDALYSIAKHKYIWSIIPISLIIISFIFSRYDFLESNLSYQIQRYITLIGIFIYGLIVLSHKVNRPNCEIEVNVIYSPVNGKIYEILKNDAFNTIRVKKSIFDKCDLRCCHSNEEVISSSPFIIKGKDYEWSVVEGNVKQISQSLNIKDIFGYCIGSATIEIRLSSKVVEDLYVGQVLKSGETKIGKIRV